MGPESVAETMNIATILAAAGAGACVALLVVSVCWLIAKKKPTRASTTYTKVHWFNAPETLELAKLWDAKVDKTLVSNILFWQALRRLLPAADTFEQISLDNDGSRWFVTVTKTDNGGPRAGNTLSKEPTE